LEGRPEDRQAAQVAGRCKGRNRKVDRRRKSMVGRRVWLKIDLRRKLEVSRIAGRRVGRRRKSQVDAKAESES